MTHLVEARLAELLDLKMQRRVDGERSSLTVADAEERLKAFLDGEVTDVAQLSGGGANSQFSFELDGEKLVLRVKATAGICQTDVEREFQILRATEGVIPVPHAHSVTSDRSVFGEPALITGWVDGVAAPVKDKPKATGLGTAYGALAPKLAPDFISYLGKLHAYDWSGDDLSLYDKPAAGTTEAIDKRLGFWDRVWEEDRLEVHPTVLLTQQWLHERRPVCDHVSLLHGDYRNGNFMFDEDEGRITAILDWELGYLGDRHSDLGYAMLPGWGHPDENGEYLCAGLRSRDAFIAEYEAASGLEVDRERLEYYIVLNLYWAVVALYGTGPRVAVTRQTHIEVMMNFLAGLGGYFISELNAVLAKD